MLRVLLCALCLALALPAVASATPRTAGEDEGFVIALPPGERGSVTVDFRRVPARRYRRELAGRELVLDCRREERRSGGTFNGGTGASLTAPRRRGRVTTRVGHRNFDYCYLRHDTGSSDGPVLAAVGFSDLGQREMGDRAAARQVLGLHGVVLVLREQSGSYPDVAALALFEFVALAAPTDLPPAGKTGVFVDPASDRVHVARVAQPSGRRLFFESTGLTPGDIVVSTNILRWVNNDD